MGFDRIMKRRTKMITCKEDLINTRIDATNKELQITK